MKLRIEYEKNNEPALALRFVIESNDVCIFSCYFDGTYTDIKCKNDNADAIKHRLTRMLTKQNQEFELFEDHETSRSSSASFTFSKKAIIFNIASYPGIRSVGAQCIFPLTSEEIMQFKEEIDRVISLI